MANEILNAFKTVFRDYNTDGVPSSGAHEVEKVEVRQIGKIIEDIIKVLNDNQITGLSVFATLAELNANLAFAAKSGGMVVADSTAVNNGIYQKVGASGVGSWIKIASLLLPTSSQLANLDSLYAALGAINGLKDPGSERFRFKSEKGFVGFGYDPIRGLKAPGADFRVSKTGGVRFLDSKGFGVRLMTPTGTLIGSGGQSSIASPVVLPIDEVAPCETFIIAHRGFAHLAPENTLPAFAEAYRHGAFCAECDIQVSADGVPFICHDDTVDRTTNGTGSISSLSSTYLKSLDAGSWFHPKYAGTRLPTLQEFLTFCKGRFQTISPEIKSGASDAEVALVTNMIASAGWMGRAFFGSSDNSIPLRVRALYPTARICFGGSFESALSLASIHDRSFITLNKSTWLADPSLVATAKAQGIDVFAWTIRSTQERRDLARIGITKIVCDNVF